MKKHYDFAKMKGVPNPYARQLKRQITIRIGADTIDYFREMSEKTGIPYQNLIDSYLSECATDKKTLKWA